MIERIWMVGLGLLLVACGSSGPDDSVSPEGEGTPAAATTGSSADSADKAPTGTLSIALEGDDLGTGALIATLTVFDAGGADPVYSNEIGLNDVRVLADVVLPEGRYDVRLEVRRAGAEHTELQGERADVGVVAGARSSVTIHLAPAAGSVQVVAELSRRGHRWTCEEPLYASAGRNALLHSAQRVEEVCDGDPVVCRPEVRYYMWAYGAGPGLGLAAPSADPTSFDLDNLEDVTGDLRWPQIPYIGHSIAAVGDGFYWVSPHRGGFNLYRSDEGRTWTRVHRAAYDSQAVLHDGRYEFDAPTGCTLVVDSEFHAYCGTGDVFLEDDGVQWRWGVWSGRSNGGGIWDGIGSRSLTVDENPDSALPDLVFDVATRRTTTDYRHPQPYGPVAAVHERNVRRVWIASSVGEGRERGFRTIADYSFRVVESVDGESWSQPTSATFSESCPGSPEFGYIRGLERVENAVPNWALYAPPDPNEPFVAYVPMFDETRGDDGEFINMRMTSVD